MQFKTVLALSAVFLTSVSVNAETFDMGKIEVLGRDAQTQKIDPTRQRINFEMGERFTPMPQLVPEVTERRYEPMTEKQILQNIHKENRDSVSLALGAGNRGAREMTLNAQGTAGGYQGDFLFRRETRDGYRTSVDSRRSVIEGGINNASYQGYVLTGRGKYFTDKFGMPGQRTIPTPAAGIEDSGQRIGVRGHSTLDDGAYMSGQVTIDSISRDIKNPGVYSTEQSLLAFSGRLNYLKPISSGMSGIGRIQVGSEKIDYSAGNNRSFSSAVFDLGVDYEFSSRTNAEFGLRYMNMKNVSDLGPFAEVNHRLSDPLRLSLSYDERLGNNSLETLYMPSRYVVTDDFRASKIKTIKSSVDYRTVRGDNIGAELFVQKEVDGIEYLDDYDPAKQLFTSRINQLSEIRRRGTAIRGDFQLEDNFRINIKKTFQKTEDNVTSRRISYEPRRILDVGFNYTENRLMIDFTRRAEFSRVAHTPVNSFDADDYARSDIVAKYKFNDRYRAYLKIEDLYDKRRELRYDVPEQGRVSILGVEAHF